jgi:leader peptidase (prepilin peptidase) / N-methyltransferase
MHGVSTWTYGLFFAALGAAIGWGILWAVALLGKLVFRKEAMGFGDVKLMGAIGAFFGWKAVLFTILVSSLVGSIVGVSLVVARRRDMQSRIPYGPYLSLAAVLWVFWGPHLWNLYLRLLTPDYLTVP